MFKLIVNEKIDKKGAIKTSHTTIGLKWHLTTQGLSTLEEKNIENAYMLIIVGAKAKNGSIKEDLHIVKPIGEKEAFISFFRPGVNTIHTAIIFRTDWEDYCSDKDLILEEYYNSTYYGQVTYAHSVINNQGKFNLRKPYIGYQQVRVMVDDKLFAPPTPEWKKKVLKFVLKESAVKNLADQCKVRKLYFQAIAMAFFALAVTILRVVVAIGCYMVPLNINLRPIIHPIDMDFSDIWSGSEPIWWRAIRNKTSDLHETWYLFVLSPIYWVLMFGLMKLFSHYFGNLGVSWGLLFSAIFATIPVLIIVVFIFFVLIDFLVKIFKRQRQKNIDRSRARDRASASETIYVSPIKEKYQKLVEGEIEERSLKYTLKHNFGEAKIVLCKTFARDD